MYVARTMHGVLNRGDVLISGGVLGGVPLYTVPYPLDSVSPES